MEVEEMDFDEAGSLVESCAGNDFLDGSPFYLALANAQVEAEMPTRKAPKKEKKPAPQIWAMSSMNSFNKTRFVEDVDETAPVGSPQLKGCTSPSNSPEKPKKKKAAQTCNNGVSHSVKEAEVSLAEVTQRVCGSGVFSKTDLRGGELRSLDSNGNTANASVVIPHPPQATPAEGGQSSPTEGPAAPSSSMLQFKPRQRTGSVCGSNPPAPTSASQPVPNLAAANASGGTTPRTVTRPPIPAKVQRAVQIPMGSERANEPKAADSPPRPPPKETTGFGGLPVFANARTQSIRSTLRERSLSLNRSPANERDVAAAPRPQVGSAPASRQGRKPEPPQQPQARSQAPKSGSHADGVAGKTRESSAEAKLPTRHFGTPALRSAWPFHEHPAPTKTVAPAADACVAAVVAGNGPAHPTEAAGSSVSTVKSAPKESMGLSAAPSSSGPSSTSSELMGHRPSKRNSSNSTRPLLFAAKANGSAVNDTADSDSNTSSSAGSSADNALFPGSRERRGKRSFPTLFPPTVPSPPVLSLPASARLTSLRPRRNVSGTTTAAAADRPAKSSDETAPKAGGKPSESTGPDSCLTGSPVDNSNNSSTHTQHHAPVTSAFPAMERGKGGAPADTANTDASGTQHRPEKQPRQPSGIKVISITNRPSCAPTAAPTAAESLLAQSKEDQPPAKASAQRGKPPSSATPKDNAYPSPAAPSPPNPGREGPRSERPKNSTLSQPPASERATNASGSVIPVAPPFDLNQVRHRREESPAVASAGARPTDSIPPVPAVPITRRAPKGVAVPAPPPLTQNAAGAGTSLPRRSVSQPKREELRFASHRVQQKLQRGVHPYPHLRSHGVFCYPYPDTNDAQADDNAAERRLKSPSVHRSNSPEPPQPLPLRGQKDINSSLCSEVRWSMDRYCSGTKYLRGSFASTVMPGDYGDWSVNPLVTPRNSLSGALPTRLPDSRSGSARRSAETNLGPAALTDAKDSQESARNGAHSQFKPVK